MATSWVMLVVSLFITSKPPLPLSGADLAGSVEQHLLTELRPEQHFCGSESQVRPVTVSAMAARLKPTVDRDGDDLCAVGWSR